MKAFVSFRILLLAVVLLIVSCSNSTESNTGPDNAKLDAAYTSARQMTGLKSLVISYKGSIIKEEYFGTGKQDTPQDVRSATKSVTSLLISIAIEQGIIPSVDQYINTYLSSLVDRYPADKASLKISHIITMSGGFNGNELTDPTLYNSWSSSDDRIKYILDVPLDYTPGTHFSYDSRPYNLLSVILAAVSGTTTRQYAQTNLFTPLGINCQNWLADNKGYNNGSAGLFLTSRDMIKIGELVLNEGMYNGNRIISQNWINQLKQSKISTSNAIPYGTDYSYGWWLGSYNSRNFIFAMGYGGQFIIIVPDLNLVVVATNDWSSISDSLASQRWKTTIDLIMQQILDAF